jgi:hypothetical protein
VTEYIQTGLKKPGRGMAAASRDLLVEFLMGVSRTAAPRVGCRRFVKSLLFRQSRQCFFN